MMLWQGPARVATSSSKKAAPPCRGVTARGGAVPDIALPSDDAFWIRALVRPGSRRTTADEESVRVVAGRLVGDMADRIDVAERAGRTGTR